MKWNLRICCGLILILMFTTNHPQISEPMKEDTSISPSLKKESQILSSVNETIAYGPSIGQEVYWGWAGNLSYTYWDITVDKGIPEANVTCYLLGISPVCFDLGNGTYLVEVNTTYLSAQPMWYYLFVSFNMTGFENQEVVTPIRVLSVPTLLVVSSPEVNQIDVNPYHLIVPLGDMIDLQFSYNDVEGSEGYIGGLEGAQVYARVVGPTLVENYMEVVDQGNGFYNLTFDTTSDWLFESVGGIPTSHELSYLIYIVFELENRQLQECLLYITIVDIPTEFQITPVLENIVNDEQLSIFVSLVDIWPTHDGLPVQGLNITVESSDPTLLEVVSITENSPEPGVYNITLYHRVPASVDGGCTGILYAFVDLTINLEKEGYEGVNEVVNIGLWSHTGLPLPRTRIYGIPITILIVVVVGVFEYRKRKRGDMSVPKESNR